MSLPILETKYPVVEIFKSYQMEGFNQGKEVVFVRFAGCNLECAWCDTDYSKAFEMSIPEIIDVISDFGLFDIVITGGEPTIHNLEQFLKALKMFKSWIAIETNGTNKIPARISRYLDYISVSPKSCSVNVFQANEVRIPVDGGSFTIEYLKRIQRLIEADRYYLSPVERDGKFEFISAVTLLNQINGEVDKKWRLSLQTHKLLGIR